MIYKKIMLNTFNKNATKEAALEVFLHEESEIKRPAMLVVPGGGYFSLAPLEGETVALRYQSEGFNTFVLTYAINKPYPASHLDLAVATLFICLQKTEYGLDGNLFMAGFSAGGHLVGSFAYLYDELAAILEINPEVLLPTAIILSYPVISFVHNAHIASRDILTGSNPSLFDKFSIERHISKSYPPTFIWTTLGDKGVNPSNSIDMVESLQKAGVLHESYFFDGNLDHGQSIVSLEVKGFHSPLTKEELECKSWVDKSLNFIIKNFY